MITCQVALLLCRELLRTLLVPLRVLLYLPRRHHWRREARQALATAAGETQTDANTALADFLRRHRPPRGKQAHLFLSAGEPSGEMHAARLLDALHHGTTDADRGLRCTAFGGAALARAGATVRAQLSDHAVMGVAGVLRQLPLLLGAVADFLRLLRDDPPDLVVLVDYPGLHLVLAKAARRAGVPVLHYVAPQYWAWGPWRMRRYRRAVDATLTILPFETAFFRRYHIPAAYIGHPLLDELAAAPPDPAATAAVHSQPTLVLLPGSRSAEIRANLPGLLQVAAALRQQAPQLRCVVAHKNPRRADLLRQLIASDSHAQAELQIGPLGPWLAGGRLVLAKSGTGSLEACLHGTPTIVVYQLRGPLASVGYHSLLSVPWIAAANLIANRMVVPEFCFHRASGWHQVAVAAAELWRDGPARAAACRDLAEVRRRLGAAGATERTARLLREFLHLVPR